MQEYLDLLAYVSQNGKYKENRTGVNTFSIFGEQLKIKMNTEFPILTTKEINFHAVKVELLWFLRGYTNIEFLHKHGVHIWDNWADPQGNVGNSYGAQWRRWNYGSAPPIDQIEDLIKNLKNKPNSRRHVVTAWNPSEIFPEDSITPFLPPCHYSFQMNVEGYDLDCLVNMRSCDIFLGLPFNISSYALLCFLIAKETDLNPRNLIFSFGDLHLYENLAPQALRQLQRKPYQNNTSLVFRNSKSIFELEPDDIYIYNYFHHEKLPGEIAV